MKMCALAAVAALLLAGCGTGSTTTADAPRGTNTGAETVATATESVAAETTTEEPPVEETTSEAPSDGVGAWGETREWGDGISVTVSAPEEFTPSEYAGVSKEWPTHLSFNVTVVNNTGAPFDPSMIYVTAQSGNVEAEQVFDYENGFEGTPTTTLLDGRESQFKVGFGVQDPNDVVLELTPSFEHDAGIWTS